MAIDECEHNFKHLSTKVLPGYMAEMRKRIREPCALADFAIKDSGVAAQVERLGLDKDFEGCYVIISRKKPIYVGISRTVISRLIHHVKGNTHNTASLTYRMACKKSPHKKTRTQAMGDDTFKQAFDAAKKYLCRSSVAFLEIPNSLELYLFEAYCAMELDTKQWNKFRTH